MRAAVVPGGKGAVRIGTSGWCYREWRGGFYPAGLRSADYLKHYAGRFDTVEIDATFYRQPKPATVDAWRDGAPPGFVFACKAHRFITHMKKLKDPAEGLANQLPLLERLGDRLGPILFQLPPRWQRNDDRLQGLLEALPKGRHRYVVEFRDESWNDRAVYALLERHGVAYCQSDIAGRPLEVLTARFTYLRLHGPDPEKPYFGRYDGRRLAGWAARIARWRDAGTEVFCYFDNTAGGDAPGDALRLLGMLRRG